MDYTRSSQGDYLIAPRVNPDTIARWATITLIMPTVLTSFQSKPHEAR